MGDSDIVDIAIVGAGPAGAYLAWRILSCAGTPAPQVVVLEADHRVGGRLLSAHHPALPGVPIELGGYGFLYKDGAGHRLVAGVVAELGLSVQEMPMSFDSTPFLLRGQRVEAQNLSSLAELYKLSEEETANISNLLYWALGRILEKCGSSIQDATPEWIRDEATILEGTLKGKALHELPMLAALALVLTSGGFSFVQDTNALVATTASFNAADAVAEYLTNDFGGFNLYHVDAGYDRVPGGLMNRVTDLGATLILGRALTKVELVEGSTDVLLEFTNPTQQIRARRAILAMPPAALRAVLDEDPPGLTGAYPTLNTCLQATHPDPILREYRIYPSRWWAAAGAPDGSAITDLPIRQTYAFPADTDPQSEDPTRTTGLLLSVWRDPLGTRDAQRAWRWLPDDTPRDVGTQLELLLGAPEPRPLGVISKRWSGPSWGGAWNLWMPGVRSSEVISLAQRPIEGAALHLCGEPFSHAQGWTEGAFQSAEALLVSLGYPAWDPPVLKV